jgi:Spy/CpxP family protein refolding chaperone
MALEGQIKNVHLTLLIRIKNLLTPEQQAKLDELKPKLPADNPPQ